MIDTKFVISEDDILIPSNEFSQGF